MGSYVLFLKTVVMSFKQFREPKFSLYPPISPQQCGQSAVYFVTTFSPKFR